MTRSPMLRLNMDSETKMGQLLGFVYVDGVFKIKADGPLVQAMREGLVLLIDEGDTAAEKVLGPHVQAIRQGVVVVVLGGMSFGQEGAQYGFERVRLHPNFQLVITQNPASYGQRLDWSYYTLSIADIETFDSVPREVV
jgi:MoxR-like ATPase